jgi:hypothetical protein
MTLPSNQRIIIIIINQLNSIENQSDNSNNILLGQLLFTSHDNEDGLTRTLVSEVCEKNIFEIILFKTHKDKFTIRVIEERSGVVQESVLIYVRNGEIFFDPENNQRWKQLLASRGIRESSEYKEGYQASPSIEFDIIPTTVNMFLLNGDGSSSRTIQVPINRSVLNAAFLVEKYEKTKSI